MASLLTDLLGATQARGALEEIIKIAVSIRRTVILQKQDHETAKSIGTRFYDILKERIISLQNSRQDLGIFILNYDAFSFCIGSRAFQLRFCRDYDDNIDKKRFYKIPIELKQQDLFDPTLNEFSKDLEEINENHIYLVFKADPYSELYGASLNRYREGELKEQESFDYLIKGNSIPSTLTDMNSERKEAKEISSAAGELQLKGNSNAIDKGA